MVDMAVKKTGAVPNFFPLVICSLCWFRIWGQMVNHLIILQTKIHQSLEIHLSSYSHFFRESAKHQAK